ncbi:MAG: ribosomal protein S18-alanine N-acetyltransferase [Syntrophobacteraceae bacterium]|nr:ribosomal protein S18-alanine N-acetyltransferase [Desulfobacteraceae bacterium]
MHLSITPMAPEDIPAVVEIERNSNLEPWTAESFLEELGRPRSVVLVARAAPSRNPGEGTEEGGACAVVGYVCFWCVADEVQILNIAVAPAHRRMGIGRRLLHDSLQWGRKNKARFAVLEVRPSNTAAQMLYERAGFRIVGKRPDYYGVVKEPALLMELEMIDEQWE